MKTQDTLKKIRDDMQALSWDKEFLGGKSPLEEFIARIDALLAMPSGATFILDNGQRVQVGSAAELVQLMHAIARTQAADDKGYMLDVADRVRLQHDVTIRTSSAEAFVNDLVRHKMIRTAS